MVSLVEDANALGKAARDRDRRRFARARARRAPRRAARERSARLGPVPSHFSIAVRASTRADSADTSTRCGCRRPGRARRSGHRSWGSLALARYIARGRRPLAIDSRITRSFSATTSSSSSSDQVVDRAKRAEARSEQRFGADRVADPGDDPLIEHRVADLAAGAERRRRSPAATASKPGRSGSGPSCISAGSLRARVSDVTSQQLCACLRGDRAARRESPPGPAVRHAAVGGNEDLAVHAEVGVQDNVPGEMDQQMLATTLGLVERAANRARRRGGATASVGSEPRRARSRGRPTRC